MRITERKLRRIIRSVIKEVGIHRTDPGIGAQQIRKYQNHPNRLRDSNDIKKWKEEMIRQNWENRGHMEFCARVCADALVEYCKRPEVRALDQKFKNISREDIEELVMKCHAMNNSDEVREGAREELADLLGIGLVPEKFIYDDKFWKQVGHNLNDELYADV